MGTIIKSIGFCQDKDIHSLIELAASAAEDCISKACMDKNDIHLLISTGVFRDGNIVEPAMAPLIQKRLGINLRYTENHGTFAFDILNGTCGLLSAIQTADAMLANGTIRTALIVSSDVHPSKTRMSGFPYSSIGTAMLLERSDEPQKGFMAIEFRSSPPGYVGKKSIVDFRCRDTNAGKTVDIQIEPDYLEKLYAFSSETIKALLNKYKDKFNLDTSCIKLVTTHPWKGFGPALSRAIGLDRPPAECLYEKYGDPHSAALSVAYYDACSTGRLQEGDRIAFLAAGSGLNVGIGLYFA